MLCRTCGQPSPRFLLSIRESKRPEIEELKVIASAVLCEHCAKQANEEITEAVGKWRQKKFWNYNVWFGVDDRKIL